MGSRDLFDKGSPYKILKSSDIQTVSKKVESGRNVEAKIKQGERFIPQIDYSDPNEFVRFGSAEMYYTDAFDRVLANFPYDGSEAEQTEFYNSSSYLDLYVFDKEYPRTTGFVTIHASGYSPGADAIDGWKVVPPADKEYIIIKGGPHTASGGMASGTLASQFTGANYYDTDIYDTDRQFPDGRDGTRLSNLRYDLSDGVTVEFWIKKDAWGEGSDTDTRNKTAILDLWNGEITGTSVSTTTHDHSQYGRLLIYLTASGPVETGTGGLYPFGVHIASGSTVWDLQLGSTITTSSMAGNWEHFAFTFQSSSANSSLEAKLFHSGAYIEASSSGDIGTFGEVTGSLVAYLGALQTAPSGNAFKAFVSPNTTYQGYGGLEASMDEFRYWKTTRTAEDIGLNYFRQVRGGTNTDPANADLGVYYKFNEGITGTSSIDAITLDYSGRISNGLWYNYPGSTARNTGSAMVSASAISEEWEDPIIRSDNALVTDARSALIASGTVFDYTNNSTLYNRLPGWIVDEDPGTLKQMMQIMSSYMDSIHLQIEELPTLKDVEYVSGSNKPIPVANRLVANYGMQAPEIFADADILAQIMSRDEVRNFELDIKGVKDRIYKNIYNNLVYIYKSKGTLKSFRNLIRCYGVGDDVVRLNLYGNNTVQKIRDNYDPTVSRKNYVNFNHPDSFAGVVTQQSATLATLEPTFVSGAVNEYLATTSEVDVIFPKKITDRGSLAWFNTPFLSSSIFGTHVPHDSSPLCYRQITTNDDCSWGLYAVRAEEESPDARFLFKSHRSGTPDFHLTTSVYSDVYDNSRWNFAVRTKNVKFPSSDIVSGSDAGSASDYDIDDTYTVLELYGVNYEGGILKNEFYLTSSALSRIEYLTSPHRYYLGAEKTNWTGSLNTQTDIHACSLMHWESYIEDEAIRAHGKDPKNRGALRPGRSAYLMQSALTGTLVPESETLALHWNFDNVTGSDTAGGFLVEDATYPVLTTVQNDLVNRYHDNQNNPQFANTVGSSYDGQAYNMRLSSTGAVDRAYIDAQRQNAPESLSAQDTISILSHQDDVEFTRETRPINYYFAFEKSMYATITQEIMNFFGSVVAYNDLIGDPKNRYRQDYKELGKLRELFFEKIGNTPDLDKYIDYYKWIDQSLSAMLQQLVPATADFSDGIRTMVESHALERNKYWNKFPTLEMKVTDPEAAVRGITELKYDWEHGHAPLMVKAAGQIRCLDTTIGNYNNETIILVDGAGKSITYKYTSSSGGVATGGLNTDGSVSIKLHGVSGLDNIAAQVRAAINSTNGHGSSGLNTISATANATAAITDLTQNIAGESGNTTIVSSDTGDTSIPTQFAGGTGGQSDNCMWWNERAERDKNNASAAPGGASAAINTDREAQREIIETYRTGSPGPTLAQSTVALPAPTYQGSTYALRRFDEIYNFIVDESPLYHGGPDYSQRKRYGFITPQIRTLADHPRNEFTVIGPGSPDYGKDCDDAIVPPELDKKKVSYKFESNAASIALGGPYEDMGVGDIYSPFSVYSSSVQTGYQNTSINGGRKLTDIVSGGISNMHHDIIGNDMEVPMQGPFTEKYVGGNQWRHQDLVHDPATTGSSSGTKRAEGFLLVAGSDNSLALSAVRSTSATNAAAVYTRDEAAKRPVNIRNIQMTASDIGAYKTTLPAGTGTPIGPTPTEFISGTLRSNIGNFENFYDIVQTSGRDINNVYFVDNSGISASVITSVYVTGVIDYAKPDRGKHEHVFVERFSAPGGPEVAGDSDGGYGLDLEGAVYSPYNVLTWRNTSVRTPLNRTLLVNHANQFGFYSASVEHEAVTGTPGGSTVSAADYSGIGSFQKANRNTLKSPALDGTSITTTITGNFYDNGYVTREIPRMETGYAWISASVVHSLAYGHGHPEGTYSNSSGIHSSIDFVSSSDFISYDDGARRYGADYLFGTNTQAFHQTTHLNTNIVEPLSASEATLGYETTTPVGFYINYGNIDTMPNSATINESFIQKARNVAIVTASVLHDLNIYRNGYYGYPSWKQVRTAENKLVRHYRKNNTTTINHTPGEQRLVLGIGKVTDRFGPLQSFTEPPIDNSSKPLRYLLGVNSQVGVAPDGAPMMDVKPLVIKTSYENMFTRFSNRSLEELVSINNSTVYSPYDKIKKTYLDGALSDASTPIKSFISLGYSDTIYPASYNIGLEKVRERENFKIKFWANTRAGRTAIGSEKSSSMGAPYINRFNHLTQSGWGMDASAVFEDSTPTNGSIFASASAAGELQNDYSMIHNGTEVVVDTQEFNGKQFLTASALYARKHLLYASGSTINITLDNPQTGSLGNTIPTRRQGDVDIGYGSALWEAADLAGRLSDSIVSTFDADGNEVTETQTVFTSDVRYPIDPNYESNMKDAILQNQGYSLIPEFRISSHMGTYATTQDPLSPNENLFEIYGASGSVPRRSSEEGFYKTFTNSDFMKHFEAIYEDHSGFKSPAKITLKCKAIKKFLPYDGFYPAQRTLDLSSQFSKSYGEFVNTKGEIDPWVSEGSVYPKAALRPFIAPFFAPGIMYNTIKSGLAVDYGIYTGSYEVIQNSGSGGGGELFFVGRPVSADGKGRGNSSQEATGFDQRIPFEAIVSPADYIVNQTMVDMEPHPSASMNLTASWGGQGDPLYEMMVNNFLAESINMFMPNGQMSSFVSAKEDNFLNFEIDKVYAMRLKLRKSYNQPRSYIYDGSVSDYPFPQITQDEVNGISVSATGQVTFSGVPATSALATGGKFTVTGYASIADGDFLRVADGTGNFHRFTFDTSVSTTTNNIIGISGVGSNNAMATAIEAAMDDATSSSKNFITVSVGTNIVTMAQAIAGTTGNMTPTFSGTGIGITAFSGGTDAGGRIVLTDGNGTTRKYVPAPSTAAAIAFSFPVGANNQATAVNFAARVTSFHAGQITTATPGSGVVNLTQTVTGQQGNTTITETVSNFAINDQFSGGSSNTDIRETFTMYSRPTAFGPPLAGRSFDTGGTPVNIATIKDDPLSGYNPAYTPPYYNGEAWCDIMFKAFSETHTLEEILSNAKINTMRIDPARWSQASQYDTVRSYIPYDKNNVDDYAMQLTASINIRGQASVNAITYAPDGTPSFVTDDPSSAQKVWVIEPKFETPMFNFCSTSGSLRPITEADGNLTMPSLGKSVVPRGMWHQFGIEADTPEKGIFMEVEDISNDWTKNKVPGLTGVNAANYYQSEVTSQRGYLSLMDQVQFNKTGTKLGQIADSFEVSEAIVAIPYVVVDGNRQFFEIPRQSLVAYQSIQNDASARVSVKASENPLIDLGASIERQFDLMKKYVIPPPFNCLDFDTVDPVAMYIFEFSHTFNKQDLSYIWQNLPPQASTKIDFAESTVSHPLLTNELMGYLGSETDRAIQQELHWMVFKVKQKANINYYDKLLTRAGSDNSLSIGFNTEDGLGNGSSGVVENAVYSYNWPYDFFSLVEFANLESEVVFENQVEVPNSEYLVEPDSTSE